MLGSITVFLANLGCVRFNGMNLFWKNSRLFAKSVTTQDLVIVWGFIPLLLFSVFVSVVTRLVPR